MTSAQRSGVFEQQNDEGSDGGRLVGARVSQKPRKENRNAAAAE
jgi:hypothetical protein